MKIFLNTISREDDIVFILTECWKTLQSSVHTNDNEEDWIPEVDLSLNELMRTLKRIETTELSAHDIEEWRIMKIIP